jgi:RNA polymerase sigma-54 factor
MLKQTLSQKLLQRLSPQQIMLMKLLQIPTIALEQRIKQEIEENPTLIEAGAEDLADENPEIKNEEPKEDTEEAGRDDEIDMDYYFQDDEIPAYKLKVNNTSRDDDRPDIPFVSGSSFQDNLYQQLGLTVLTEEEEKIAKFIIGTLDDSGYLNRSIDAIVDDLAFTQNINTTTDKVKKILETIQSFDPPGVGARNLKECLLIQLKRKNNQEDINVNNAILLLEKAFTEFTHKHYQKIIRKTKLSEEELKEAINEILTLNPKPGNSLSDSTRTNHYVIPDFIIRNNDGELDLQLNDRHIPDIKVSRKYLRMLEDLSKAKNKKMNKESIQFIKQKIDSAKWFIDAVKQRQITLYTVMESIVNHQKDFFLTGNRGNLKPMILKDIAEQVNLDISTISRVANSKYVQTPYGTFLLKEFFSESMTKEDGEEVSTYEIKKILQDLIDMEDKKKPWTDEQLAGKLKEKGYKIARRTIAKYREQLGIPVARLRKKL